MSAAFEVGMLTIGEALRILEGQGWIRPRFPSGAYVADPESLADRLTTGRGRQSLQQLREEGREIPSMTLAGDVLPTAVLGFHEARIEALVEEITAIALRGGVT